MSSAIAIASHNFTPILAQSSTRQDEVFRQIQNSMGAPTDPLPLIVFMAVMVVAIVLIALIQHRRSNPTSGDKLLVRAPKPIHSHPKLTRELASAAQIDPEVLARAAGRARSVGAQSPLTVLLLSSLNNQAPQPPRQPAQSEPSPPATRSQN